MLKVIRDPAERRQISLADSPCPASTVRNVSLRE
jgi:hypothetical protein